MNVPINVLKHIKLNTVKQILWKGRLKLSISRKVKFMKKQKSLTGDGGQEETQARQAAFLNANYKNIKI